MVKIETEIGWWIDLTTWGFSAVIDGMSVSFACQSYNIFLEVARMEREDEWWIDLETWVVVAVSGNFVSFASVDWVFYDFVYLYEFYEFIYLCDFVYICDLILYESLWYFGSVSMHIYTYTIDI